MLATAEWKVKFGLEEREGEREREIRIGVPMIQQKPAFDYRTFL